VSWLTTCTRVPRSPPAIAARNPDRQNVITLATSGLMPSDWMALGESADAVRMRPSRLTRRSSTATTPTTAMASAKW